MMNVIVSSRRSSGNTAPNGMYFWGRDMDESSNIKEISEKLEKEGMDLYIVAPLHKILNVYIAACKDGITEGYLFLDIKRVDNIAETIEIAMEDAADLGFRIKNHMIISEDLIWEDGSDVLNSLKKDLKEHQDKGGVLKFNVITADQFVKRHAFFAGIGRVKSLVINCSPIEEHSNEYLSNLAIQFMVSHTLVDECKVYVDPKIASGEKEGCAAIKILLDEMKKRYIESVRESHDSKSELWLYNPEFQQDLATRFTVIRTDG